MVFVPKVNRMLRVVLSLSSTDDHRPVDGREALARVSLSCELKRLEPACIIVVERKGIIARTVTNNLRFEPSPRSTPKTNNGIKLDR